MDYLAVAAALDLAMAAAASASFTSLLWSKL